MKNYMIVIMIRTVIERGILRMYLWYFGGCRQIPTEKNVSGSKLCRRDGGILAKSDDIWLSGRHVADMSATFSAKPITQGYEKSGLPGCCGLMDVVHVRWSQCPTGDLNRAKGKESFPTLAFECVTDFNRQILGVYGPHFGLQNDKEIVKSDPTV